MSLVAGFAPATTAYAQSAPMPPHRSFGAASEDTSTKAVQATRHFIANLDGGSKPFRLGFDMADTGDGGYEINHLPRGVKALVWMGQKCPTPPTRSFKADVRRLADNRKVFGYYLSDEPHEAGCPSGAEALRQRTKFIDRVTQGRQLTFVVLEDPRDYDAFKPSRTGVDLVGLDPYPCSINNTPRCDLTKIGQRVRQAMAAGIARSKLVPVYQAFGQERTTDRYYLLPTPKELRAMLARWDRFLPRPVMDYAYGWGNQSSSNPTLIDAPGLQDVFVDRFAG